MGTTGANGLTTITLDAEGLAEYQEYLRHTKQRNVAKRLDDMGAIKAGNRRQTLVMRRMKDKLMEIAPDEDIAAYGEIYKLKNPSANPKLKTYVSDNEIKAYKVLDPDFKVTLTLQALTDKVEEMKAAGELTGDDDLADEVEEQQEETAGND